MRKGGGSHDYCVCHIVADVRQLEDYCLLVATAFTGSPYVVVAEGVGAIV